MRLAARKLTKDSEVCEEGKNKEDQQRRRRRQVKYKLGLFMNLKNYSFRFRLEVLFKKFWQISCRFINKNPTLRVAPEF